jgi:glycosyltransferase involved in cell wall biosynthesis
MTRVVVGVHAYEGAERLDTTIASLVANTAVPFEWRLLPDGPDGPTSAAIARYPEVTSLSSLAPSGAAAGFNRLAAVRDADVVVLLESGCQVAPGWLPPLLAALEDRAIGLAGPSTNSCWNEQGAFPQCAGAPAEIASVAEEAARRFGAERRTLEPLYSLADFCYAVRREVIEQIGPADESYGLGPCWEMDYNIRAARAGFRGVWVCGSFVHRAPFTIRRRVEEARRFDASRHRYQDKFCGRHLRGETTAYRSHCRGDACANFAPPALIQIRTTGAVTPDAPTLAALSPPAPRPATSGSEPLVTCIMPTTGRHAWLGQAIRSFLRQQYPRLELVVLGDAHEPSCRDASDDPRIRYERIDRPMTLGAKRNAACSLARGDIIVHWDDDDWYSPSRIDRQVRALMDQPAHLCGSSRVLYYQPSADRAWEYRYGAGLPTWLAGNTLAYTKETWQRAPFPDVQVGEDAMFVWNDGRRRLHDLADPHLCVGMIHAGNTSRKETNGAFWHAVASATVHGLLGDEVHFYRSVAASGAAPDAPLVSCIMPTFNRRAMVPLALQSFARQDYPRRELIVVDDGDDPVADLVQGVDNVRYFRLAGRRAIGSKRNFACEQAQGDIIAHWDDDDWYSPERLRYQVAPVVAGDADITGLENAFVLETAEGRFWSMRDELHRQMFLGDVHGGTLVFRRQLFVEGLRYPEVNLAEDAWLLHTALKRGKRLLKLTNPGVFVYMRHGRNAWKECVPGRFLNPSGWKRVARPLMFSTSDLSSYQAAAAAIGS